jgi:putative membrane protein
LTRVLTMRRAVFAGAIAGLVGTWAMSQAQRLWTLMVDGKAPQSAGGRHDARDWQERSEHRNSNELAAQAVARHVLGRRLTWQELRLAAPLSHYAFGAAMGAIYGPYAERRRARSGAGFGIALWLAADQIAMPLLGLSRSTSRRPTEMQAQSLVAHLVYGAGTELTRRLVRAQFARDSDPRPKRRSSVETEALEGLS